MFEPWNSSVDSMYKLWLTGQIVGRDFNFRYKGSCVPCTSFTTAKLANLKLQTQPNHLLGYLPLTFALPVDRDEITLLGSYGTG
jgi:hypothetical protein